jgi:hypothetical protein
MTPDERDELILRHLDGGLDAADAARLREHLRLHPEDAARMIDLADEELFLREGLQETAGSRRTLPALRLRPARSRVSPFLRLAPLAAAAALLLALAYALLDATSRRPAAGPPADPPRVATLESVTGEADLVRNGRRAPSTPGGALRAGDILATGPDAAAVVRYADGTVATLGGSSALRVDVDAPGKRLRLLHGAVACAVTPQPADAPLVLATPEARATVAGTRLTLASRGGATALEVTEGRVRLADTALDVEVSVGAGERAVADNRTAPRPLPLAAPNAPAPPPGPAAAPPLPAPQPVAATPPPPAPVPLPSSPLTLYEDRFDNGLPPGWTHGRPVTAGLPEGVRGAVRQEHLRNDSGEDHHQVASRSDYERGLFAVEPGDVVHVTYRCTNRGFFELFLCMRRPDRRYGCNLIHRVEPSSATWTTVDVPLTAFRRTEPVDGLDGLVCFHYFFDSQMIDSGLEVARVWVTRQPR